MSNTEQSKETQVTQESAYHESEGGARVKIDRRRVRNGHAWTRPALIWLLVACVPGLLVGVASHLFSVEPLEKRLLQVEALQTAKQLEAVVKMRAAAIQIAASTRSSSSLVDTKGLDRLLAALRGSFPDFLSMEILDEHGDILAMVGELPLSEATKSVGKSKTPKVGTMSYRDRDLFRDSPESDSFVLTVKHKGQEGKVWFTRTRFAREPIKLALSMAREKATAALMPLPDGEADGFSTPATSWWAGPSATTVKLGIPGWAIRVKSRAARSMFPLAAAIAAGLIAAIIGLAFVYRRVSSPSALSSHAAIQTSESMSGKQATSVDAEEAQSSESEDVWTPRNVPLGFGEPPEAEIVETYSPEIGESIGDTDPEGKTAELHTGSAMPAEPVEQRAIAGEDIPEILDVVWLESDTPCSPEFQPGEPQTAESMEAPWDSHGRIPETLDVMWLEPDSVSSGQQQPESEEKTAPKASPVVHSFT